MVAGNIVVGTRRKPVSPIGRNINPTVGPGRRNWLLAAPRYFFFRLAPPDLILGVLCEL